MASRFPLAAAAIVALSTIVPGTPARAQDVDPAPALEVALAREKDAETLASLSAEGGLLYARERVKLTGFQYCGQAVSLAENGEFRQSIRAASKALYLAQRTNDATLRGASYRDLAIAYSYAGLLERASEFALRALEEPGADKALILAPSNKVLGDVALRKGDGAQALSRYQAAMRDASDRYRPLVEASLANALLASGDLKGAREAYDRLPVPSDPQFRQTYLRGLGQLRLAEGDTTAAIEVFESALRSASGSDAAYHRLWAHEGLGRAFLARKDLARATQAFIDAVNAADAVRARFRSEEFKTALFGDVQRVFDQAIALAMASGRHAEAFDISEKSRSRALLDLVRQRLDGTQAAGRPRSVFTVTAARVREVIEPNEALVEFHGLGDRLFAWVVRRDGVNGFEIAVNRDRLTGLVSDFRASIVGRKAEALAKAQELHGLLMEPLGLRSGERLLIVPHGPMHYLPFQALKSGDSFLIERNPIAVAPSASLAIDAVLRGTRDAQSSLVAFGNPRPDDLGLPGAEREVEALGGLFNGSQVFVRTQASKGKFNASAGSGRILHVAAHAAADEVDPMYSKILLAPEGSDDGVLVAKDIFSLDLSRVRLVTLSACETGLGKTLQGDEVLGFTRSFLTAGASSLVSSLWPVSDAATSQLMKVMYQELANGRDLASAMQGAQVALLKTQRFRHPFSWAPFSVTGDWRQQLAR